MSKNHEDHLIQEAKKITIALGKMFAPFCEVVLHDLRSPQSAIIAIENNFSGRSVGDSTTNVGLQRAVNVSFPEILQNYQNVLSNGKVLKSTSIGIKNEHGKYIASICLNFDTSFFKNISSQLELFTATEPSKKTVTEELRSLSIQEISEVVHTFAQDRHATPKELSKAQKLELIHLLENKGLLQLRNAISNLAHLLDVTRPTIYTYLKAKE
jgi:predicted transcriptional regulator YheO